MRVIGRSCGGGGGGGGGGGTNERGNITYATDQNGTLVADVIFFFPFFSGLTLR